MKINIDQLVHSISVAPNNCRISVSQEIYYEEPRWGESIEIFIYLEEENNKITMETAFCDAVFRSYIRSNGKPNKADLIVGVKEMDPVEISSEEFFSIYNETTESRLPRALEGISTIESAFSLFTNEPSLKSIWADTGGGYVFFTWQTNA